MGARGQSQYAVARRATRRQRTYIRAKPALSHPLCPSLRARPRARAIALFDRAEALAADLVRDLDRCAAIYAIMAREIAPPMRLADPKRAEYLEEVAAINGYGEDGGLIGHAPRRANAHICAQCHRQKLLARLYR